MSQSRVRAAVRTGLRLARDVLRLLSSAVRSHTHLAAENLVPEKAAGLLRGAPGEAAPRRRCDANCARRALGIRVSARTVRRYKSRGAAPRDGARSQTWTTFVRNHARAVLACDFFVTVTARFRVLYVFVVLEVGTRRILHWNLTEHPTAEWTAEQLPMVVSGEQAHRWLIHDRDSIYSEGVDATVAAMGLSSLKTPVRAPQANAFCERLIGTIRRECLIG
jgi:putative transposase